MTNELYTIGSMRRTLIKKFNNKRYAMKKEEGKSDRRSQPANLSQL